MFSRSNYSMMLSVTLPDETGSYKSKMATEIMYRSNIHDGNKIAMAIPNFGGQESRRNKCEKCLMSVCVVHQRCWLLSGGVRKGLVRSGGVGRVAVGSGGVYCHVYFSRLLVNIDLAVKQESLHEKNVSSLARISWLQATMNSTAKV